MKRVLTVLAILLLPLSVWAMTPVNDADLSNVTGQAGVNINADLTMNINIGTMAWGDSDGVTGVSNPWTTVSAGGYIGINNFNIANLKVRARYETSDNYYAYSTLFLKPITIDVATGSKNGVANVTFVRFGLGALKISMDQLQFEVALGQRAATPVLNQKMGVVTLGSTDVYVNPWSYVDIYSHAGMGVNFDINVTLDAFKMQFMSWGDTDGLPTALAIPSLNQNNWMDAGTAGYIGLNNFVLGNAAVPAVTINGSIAIDVTTSAHGYYADLDALYTYLKNNAATSGAGYGAPGGSGTAAPLTGGEDQVKYWMAINLSTATRAANHTMLEAFQGVATDAYSGGAGLLAAYNAAHQLTVVHISFPANMVINVARMTGDVTLGDKADFSGANRVLGDIYIQGMGLTIKQGSWVDIWAH